MFNLRKAEGPKRRSKLIQNSQELVSSVVGRGKWTTDFLKIRIARLAFASRLLELRQCSDARWRCIRARYSAKPVCLRVLGCQVPIQFLFQGAIESFRYGGFSVSVCAKMMNVVRFHLEGSIVKFFARIRLQFLRCAPCSYQNGLHGPGDRYLRLVLQGFHQSIFGQHIHHR